MTLTDVLVVPGLNTDLFSCNAAFERDGIRSYFNDERHLVLPDGGKVTFVEGGHRRKSRARSADGTIGGSHRQSPFTQAFLQGRLGMRCNY
jgi:hypothetical protein